MVGLIIKDFFTMFKQTKLFMVIAIVIAAIPSDYAFGYSVFYAAMLPITALSFDEQSKWNRYADMLPYSTNAIVGSKYIIGYLSVGIIALLTLAAKGVFALFGVGTMKPEIFVALGFVVCAAVTVQALNLIFMFWLGTEKGRLLFVAVTVGTLAAIVGFLQDVGEVINSFQLSVTMVSLVMVGIMAAVNLISFFAARTLYQKKRK